MIVVTGGAGFIGSAFITTLNNAGIDDIVVVDNLARTPKWRNLVGKRFSEYLHKQRFIELLRTNALPFTPQAIVHLGACSSTTEYDLEYLFENNVNYTKLILEFCAQRNIRCVYASSAATYGTTTGEAPSRDDDATLDQLRPLNPYGFSKHMVDLWARRTGLLSQVAGVKFFNVYGPNEYHKESMASVVWKAFTTIEESGHFKLFKSHHPDYGHGEQKRDFIYVKDCCAVLWWLLNNPTVNGLFNVGSGTARSWNDLLHAIFHALDRVPNIEYIDMPEGLRSQYQYFTQAALEKLRDAGYTAPFRSLEDGVSDYIRNHLRTESRFW